jgi:rare lipoprotein A (peptidoglycan hydrolase)
MTGKSVYRHSQRLRAGMGIRVRRYLLLGIAAVTALMLWLHSGVAISGDKTQQKAEALAEKVEKKAKQTEKSEGKNDLVKDEVKVTTDAKGGKVVEQVGEASWYGKDFQGKKTSSGETFNQHDLTAAHPTLPMGTKAKVTNLETGKSVQVEINDRGPHRKGRDIDLSKEAAEEIGMKKDGAAPVKIEAKVPPEDDKKDKK